MFHHKMYMYMPSSGLLCLRLCPLLLLLLLLRRLCWRYLDAGPETCNSISENAVNPKRAEPILLGCLFSLSLFYFPLRFLLLLSHSFLFVSTVLCRASYQGFSIASVYEYFHLFFSGSASLHVSLCGQQREKSGKKKRDTVVRN